MTDELKSEHQRLLEITTQLEREHRRLQQHPEDIAGHLEHSARLREQIEALHEHIRRLRGEPPEEETQRKLPQDTADANRDREYDAMMRSIAHAEQMDVLRRSREVRTVSSSLCLSFRQIQMRMRMLPRR